MDELDDDDVPRKGIKDEGEMDITPMIDVTFLLLIFFVVASKMDPTQTGDIPEANAGLAVSANDSAVIFIEPRGEDEASYFDRNRKEFSRDEETRTTEIVEYITGEMEMTQGEAKDQVMLLGTPNVQVRHVTTIQQAVGDAFEDIEFTYIAVKEL